MSARSIVKSNRFVYEDKGSMPDERDCFVGLLPYYLDLYRKKLDATARSELEEHREYILLEAVQCEGFIRLEAWTSPISELEQEEAIKVKMCLGDYYTNLMRFSYNEREYEFFDVQQKLDTPILPRYVISINS